MGFLKEMFSNMDETCLEVWWDDEPKKVESPRPVKYLGDVSERPKQLPRKKPKELEAKWKMLK